MALLPAGQWVRWTNLPSTADFQFTDLHRYSRCKQRFLLNFAAIDISLHANYTFFFGTRIARITRICCLVSKDSGDSEDSCSKINTQHYFLSRTRISRISRIFFVASNDSYITKTASLLYYCIWCITINLD